jgi:polyisoprenoid-binding protein YceI
MTIAGTIAGASPTSVTTRPRTRHWWRWILGGVVVLSAVVVAAIGLFVTLQSAPNPLVLPAGTTSMPVGPLEGTWGVTTGSVAGFRVTESFLVFSNDVVGRTDTVTGSLNVADNHVAEAGFRVDLTTIEVGGKSQTAFAKSLDTAQHPNATISLSDPFTLTDTFTSGSRITRTVAGDLTMRGMTRPVTISLSARRDGTLLQAAGSIPIDFSRWGIENPQGLADHGIAEFLLVLHRT